MPMMYFGIIFQLLISFCIFARISHCHDQPLQTNNNISKFNLKIVPHNQNPYTRHFHNSPKKLFTTAIRRQYKYSSLPRKQWTSFPQNEKQTPFQKKSKLRGKLQSKFLKKYFIKKNNNCDGLMNLTNDISITSYVLGVISLIFGVGDEILSLVGQFISVTSTWASYATAIPSAIITLSGKTDSVTYVVANILGFLSIVVTVWSHVGIPVGYLDISIGITGEILGFVSTILGTFSTFPELLELVIEFLVKIKGPDVQHFVDSYGCFTS